MALGAFVVLGAVDGSLGVAWPSLRSAFGRGLSDLGVVLISISVGYLTASMGYGRLHARLGTGVLLGTGSVFLAAGIVGIAAAPEWPVVVTAAVAIGLGGGLVDTGMNAHAALAFDVGSVNLLHACYGLGATLGPAVITFSLVLRGSWRAGYAALAVAQVASAATVWMRRRRWAGAEPDPGTEFPARAPHLVRWLPLAMFFLYTGLEVATGQWAFTLLTEGRGMGTAAAGTWVSVYWAGLMVGRFGFGIAGARFAPSSILHSSMFLALVGVGWLWVDPLGLGAIGLPVAGLGLAAVFPTLVSSTPARIGRVASTRTMGHQLAAANVGAAGVPWIVGIVAQARGPEALGPGLFVAGIVLALVHLASGRVSRA